MSEAAPRSTTAPRHGDALPFDPAAGTVPHPAAPREAPEPRPLDIANPARVRALRAAMLVTTDFLALFGSGTVGYVAWARPIRDQPTELYLAMVPLLALFLAGYALSGLYPGFGLGPVETLRRLTRVTGFGFLVLAAVTYALKIPHLYSRVTLGLTFILALVAVPAGRALVSAIAGRRPGWSEPVVVIGEGSRAAQSVEALRDLDRLGYRPIGVLLTGGEPAGGTIEGTRVLGGIELAPELARRGVRVAILELDRLGEREAIDRLQQHFRHVITLRTVDELPVEGVQVRNLGRVLGIEYTNNLLRPLNRAIKRGVDVGLGGAALVAAAPAIVAAAVAIKLVSRGPAFYVQEREGLDGRRIRVRKIRTMHVDAERRLAEHLERRPELRREWEERYKLRDDPRLIPGLGTFLRRFSLDELPQLANVVDGSMSLVGPRPFPDYHLAGFTPEFRALRRRVWPGLTGLWQVTVRSGGSVAEQQAYDTYYIRNWSLWLDLYILGRTLGAVLTGRGAF